jgi:pantoate--beta-alanine ligase
MKIIVKHKSQAEAPPPSPEKKFILHKAGEVHNGSGKPAQSQAAADSNEPEEHVMQLMRFPCEVAEWAREQQRAGKRIGFVPTMGFLHAGHLSLVDEAKNQADVVCLSIFVNPTQFGPNEDLAAYPRDEENDLQLCREAGVDVVFLPSPEQMYAPDASVFVDEDKLQRGLCGMRRPGHFRGVCTVVAKLFNIVHPDVAVFGQKDFQQVAVIRRMVRDLNFPIDIVMVPTMREPDGLAMSSRNVYLSPTERENALGVSRALRSLGSVGQGHPAAEPLREQMRTVLEQYGLLEDYVAIVDADTLEPVAHVEHGNVALIAVYCGKTRLIDNRIL